MVLQIFYHVTSIGTTAWRNPSGPPSAEALGRPLQHGVTPAIRAYRAFASGEEFPPREAKRPTRLHSGPPVA